MMPYARVEKSYEKYSRDGIHFLTFMSPALGGRGNATVFIPPGHERDRDLPIVLLLHGVFGDHWSWAFMGGAHVAALDVMRHQGCRPMAIVMPSDGIHGEGSGYLSHPGRDCERWIVEDIPGCLRENYECFSPASPLFIAGFSMGGFGALRLGAKYPRHFRGISGHASMTHWEQARIFFGQQYQLPPMVPAEDFSALHWIEQNRHELSPLRFDCGSDDLLIQYNRELHSELEKRAIPHKFEEVPGRHSWDYCHQHVKDSLMFFHSQLSGA
jgi:enterochelin esterase-like enzyme